MADFFSCQGGRSQRFATRYLRTKRVGFLKIEASRVKEQEEEIREGEKSTTMIAKQLIKLAGDGKHSD